MSLVVAILLAVVVLPAPWGLVAVAGALVLEIGETVLFVWWSKRRRAQVGAEALVGAEGVALGPIAPAGQVRVAGEIWSARSATALATGAPVRVVGVEGLTLEVEPCD